MLNIFTGNTADEVWRQAASELKESALVQSSRAGETQELLHCVFHIEDPRQRWVLSRQPGINPAFAIAEVFWILAGRRDSCFINHWNPGLPKFAGSGENYHGAYGYRIRNNFSIDQFHHAYQALKNNPESRQVVIQIWDSNKDFPNKNGSPQNKDIPCNISCLPKIRNGRLEWMQVMRSNDLLLGTPYNFVQFTTLHEILAGWLEVELGDYHHVSDSLHIYESVKKTYGIDSKISNIPFNNDMLSLPYEKSIKVIDSIVDCLEFSTQKNLTEDRLRNKYLSSDPLPKSFQNLLAIAIADSARRRGYKELVTEIIESCSNPLLILLWKNWATRHSNQGNKNGLLECREIRSKIA